LEINQAKGGGFWKGALKQGKGAWSRSHKRKGENNHLVAHRKEYSLVQEPESSNPAIKRRGEPSSKKRINAGGRLWDRDRGCGCPKGGGGE